MGRTLAILFTMTTYGTWLRGDMRGWVDQGRVLPRDPVLEAADRERMKHSPFLFGERDFVRIGAWIGTSLRDRLDLRILAMTVRTWHVHLVVGATEHPISKIVKCAKDAARWGLHPGQPIWTKGYDKRFSFDDESVRNRIDYVERHNTALGRPPKPWDFIEDYPI